MGDLPEVYISSKKKAREWQLGVVQRRSLALTDRVRSAINSGRFTKLGEPHDLSLTYQNQTVVLSSSGPWHGVWWMLSSIIAWINRMKSSNRCPDGGVIRISLRRLKRFPKHLSGVFVADGKQRD